MNFELDKDQLDIVLRALAIAKAHEESLAREAAKIMPEAQVAFIKSAILFDDVSRMIKNQLALMPKKVRTK